MMATILNSALFDSVMLHKTLTQTSSIWLKLNHSDSTWWSSHLEFCHHGFSHFAQKNFTHAFWLNLMIAAMLKSAILNAAILYKKNFTHSFWLNLMMAAILNSALLNSETAILDSDDLLSSLRFTQKHSYSILTLTQTNSIWLKLIYSHLTWWWQ